MSAWSCWNRKPPRFLRWVGGSVGVEVGVGSSGGDGGRRVAGVDGGQRQHGGGGGGGPVHQTPF